MMRAIKVIPYIPVLVFSLLLPELAAGQSAGEILSTTVKIADKIISETEFSYRMTPLNYNGDICMFTVGPEDETGGLPVYYARMIYQSGKDAAGILGFSFRGQIKVFLNGREIFAGRSDTVIFREYTYSRYKFQQHIPVEWKKGENLVLVKCITGREPSSMLVLPLDEMDAKPGFIVAEQASAEIPGVQWIINGPWRSKTTDPMEKFFPPENGFRDYYQDKTKTIGWTLSGLPMLRELVIPGNSSYTRDAYADWHYANGGTLLGIMLLYHVTGEKIYLEHVKKYARNLLENNDYFRWQYFSLHATRGSFHKLHRMTMLDDSGGPALPLAQLMLADPADSATLPVLLSVLDYMEQGQERLPDRTFCRPEPEALTIWADDLFMSVPFLIRMAALTGDHTLYDDAANQVVRFNNYLSDPVTGLYFHGWYQNRHENTPVRWGRANGWIAWATSEALMLLPKDHPEYNTILEIFRKHMAALAGFQDESGMWHQVLDHPETFEETSCTAMFILGMARGVRMGWLDNSYREKVMKGWNALQEKISADGTVKDICRGTGIGEDVNFYQSRQRFDNDPRGLGAVLTAGCEVSMLVKN